MHRGYKDSLRKILELANRRKIIFYGTDELSRYVYKDLRDMGHDIAYFVSEENIVECEGKPVKSKYELLYESKEKIFIAAFIFQNHGKVFSALSELGFELEQDFYLSGFGGYSRKYDAFDSLLGHNRFYEKLLGFEIYGDRKENSYSIVVLGGSTTDPTVGNIPKCWARILYEKLLEVEPNLVLYNGGMGAYSANQEFYKLLRDGLKLKPSMVISFDGFNDVNFWVADETFPHLSKYERKVYRHIEQKGQFAPDTLDLRNANKIVHGLARNSEHDDSDEWCFGIKKMHGICMEFGIEYVGFLQPMIAIGTPIIQEKQKALLTAAYSHVPAFREIVIRMPFFYHKAKEFISQNEYVYDLTNIFDGKSDMYYDMCHSTQYGHEVIADHVFAVIKRILLNGRNK